LEIVMRTTTKKLLTLAAATLCYGLLEVAPATARDQNGNPIAKGCFRQKRGGAAWSRTIQLWTNSSGGWVKAAEGEGDINGCAEFWVRPGTSFQMLVRYWQGPYYWHADSDVFRMGSDDTYIGEYYVYG
jgi:hypothetical protein